jgi:CBS domain-containing protein
MPRDPAHELRVALAGPAVNVAIAAGLYLLILLFEGAAALTKVQFLGGDLLAKLLWLNLFLAGFNLLPAFPMDGGRVLRALLAQRLEYGRATRTAAKVGQMMAIGFGLVGLFANPFLLIIALFVYLGAEAEARLVEAQAVFGGMTVRQAMLTRFVALAPDDRLATAAQALLSHSQRDLPVVEDDRVVGLLTRGVQLSALQQRGFAARVAEAMQPLPPTVAAETSVEEAFQRMQRDALSALPVVEGERLVGLLTMENISELLIVSAALHGTALRQGEPVTGAWSGSWGSAARARRWSRGTVQGEPGHI